MKLAILGFGDEGKSLLSYLKKSPQYKNADIWILDKNTALGPELKRLTFSYTVGLHYLAHINQFDVIFRSPGVPYTLLGDHFKKLRIHDWQSRVSSQTALFFKELQKYKLQTKNIKPLVIGVTGTKGKGTTSTLIYTMLKNAGYTVVLAGNIGTPMIASLTRAKKADYVVLELSSFQLQDLACSPDIAVVLDIFPDHLDAHKTVREYYSAKKNIGRFQAPSAKIFFYTTNTGSSRIASVSPAQKYPLTPKHNNLKKNVEMASVVAKSCGCSNRVIRNTIKKFKGLEHRLELVTKIKSISFYNDSAGTNPAATAAAVLSFTDPIVLIAGGKDKGFSYESLNAALKKSTAQHVILFGENKMKIAHTIKNSRLHVIIAHTLHEAVQMAFARAQELAAQKESATVVFSPAAASFDMFKNYKDRGEQYKKLVRAL